MIHLIFLYNFLLILIKSRDGFLLNIFLKRRYDLFIAN